ncbi:MAG: hypothetical protein U0X40_03515 [Ferruginibacter sp.]
MDNKNDVAVCYLMWLPYGEDFFYRFFESYQCFPAGCPHDLIILFNGTRYAGGIEKYLQYLDEKNIRYSYQTMAEGLDFTAYFHLAANTSHPYICLLNTSSVIRAANWLELLFSPIRRNPQIALTGPSGSLESFYSTTKRSNSLLLKKGQNRREYFGKIKLIVKNLLYWRFLFRPFPNFHIRTAAFLVEREIFLQYPQRSPQRKFQAYLIESGRNSLTNFVRKKQRLAFFVDKYGNLFDGANAFRSNVFRKQGQEDLLISDKQSEWFAAASPDEQKRLTQNAWGTLSGTPGQ